MKPAHLACLPLLASLPLAAAACGGNHGGTGGASSESTSSSASTSTSTSGTTSTGTGGHAPQTTDHEVFGSGTRLRATVVDAGGGASDFVTFHDTMLGADCTFLPHQDGSLRCLPGGSAIYSWFADASCTEQVASSFGCPVAQYATAGSAASPSTCTVANSLSVNTDQHIAYRIYSIGSVVTQIYHKDSSNNCVADTPLPDRIYYKVGAEVPASSFVNATTESKIIGGLADETVYRGEDGSFIYAKTSDKAQGFECEYDERCVPPIRADTQGLFSDAACTMDAAIQQNGKNQLPAGCPSPLVVRQSNQAMPCAQPTYSYFSVGSPVAGTSAYAVINGKCDLYSKQAGNLSGFSFFAVGNQLPDDTFFALTDVPKGTGRMTFERKGLTTGEQLRVFGSFRDTMYPAKTCAVKSFPDGKLRCLSQSAVADQQTVFQFFADAACTTSVEYVQPGSCSSGATVPPFIALDAPDTVCIGSSQLDGVSEIHATVPYTGTVYDKSGSSCLSLGSGLPGFLYFTIGAAVSADQFPELTLTTE